MEQLQFSTLFKDYPLMAEDSKREDSKFNQSQLVFVKRILVFALVMVVKL